MRPSKVSRVAQIVERNPELGDFLRGVHAKKGVDFHLGETVTRVDEKSVTLKSGATLPADLVIAGIGVRPALTLAESAGLALDKGMALAEQREIVAGLPALGYTDAWSAEVNGTDAFTPLALAAQWASELRFGTAIAPIYTKIAAVAEGEPCCRHMGPDGAGHYVKMVHNGIEYGDMQLICEAYNLMSSGLGMTPDEMHKVFVEWNKGDLDSFLIEITANVLGFTDPDTGGPLVDTRRLERISFTYQRITVSDIPGETSFSDDWAVSP